MGKSQLTITVVYDGKVLRPETPLDLEPNTRYVITIQQDATMNGTGNAWDVLEQIAGTIEAPPDWSSEHDHHLYGTSKDVTGTGKRR